MFIFAVSLFAGLMAGLIKAVKCHSFGERFRHLFYFTKNLFVKISMKDKGVLEESYMDTLDKEMLKRGKIHYSLPILIGVLVNVSGGFSLLGG